MSTINRIKGLYATLRDELIFLKLVCSGRVKQAPDGAWVLTQKGRLDLSKSPHKPPARHSDP
jgi:hypothetical protein